MSIPKQVIGIDVSKRWLDCFLAPAGRAVRFANDAEGHRRLAAFAHEHQAFCVLEATGPFDQALGQALHAAGRPFHRANPRKARQFAKGSGFLAKTDRVDARMLAQYGETLELPPEPRPDPDRQALRSLVERRDQLVEMRKVERTRLAQPHAEAIEASLMEHVEMLDGQIAAIETQIDRLVARSRPLKRDKVILCSAPGVGAVTATVLMAYMPELGQRGRRAISALAGVAPIACDSGAMRGKRRIWGGRKRVRDGLYMAALAAARKGPFQATFKAMRASGKPAKLALIAIARKLLVALNAAIRDQKQFQT